MWSLSQPCAAGKSTGSPDALDGLESGMVQNGAHGGRGLPRPLAQSAGPWSRVIARNDVRRRDSTQGRRSSPGRTIRMPAARSGVRLPAEHLLEARLAGSVEGEVPRSGRRVQGAFRGGRLRRPAAHLGGRRPAKVEGLPIRWAQVEQSLEHLHALKQPVRGGKSSSSRMGNGRDPWSRCCRRGSCTCTWNRAQDFVEVFANPP